MSEPTTPEGLTEGERGVVRAILPWAPDTEHAVMAAIERILADRLAAVQAERDEERGLREACQRLHSQQRARAKEAEAEVKALRERVGALADAWDEGWTASELCEAPGEGMCGDCDLCNAPNPYRVALDADHEEQR